MRKIVELAFGMAIGTLLYTRLFYRCASVDWGRAVFVGLFAAVGSAIYSRVWQIGMQGSRDARVRSDIRTRTLPWSLHKACHRKTFR